MENRHFPLLMTILSGFLDEHTDYTLVFSTWSWTAEKPLSLKARRGMFEELPNTIYSAKSAVQLHDMPDHRMILQMVGKRASLTLAAEWGDEPPRTQIVITRSTLLRMTISAMPT